MFAKFAAVCAGRGPGGRAWLCSLRPHCRGRCCAPAQARKVRPVRVILRHIGAAGSLWFWDVDALKHVATQLEQGSSEEGVQPERGLCFKQFHQQAHAPQSQCMNAGGAL